MTKTINEIRTSDNLIFSVIEESLTDGSSAWSVGVIDLSNLAQFVEIPTRSKNTAYELFEHLYRAAEFD